MADKSRIGMASRISAAGEGVFLSFLAKYATLHKVCTSDDIGIDYFGEWLNIKTERSLESTNVLFAIQLKTSKKENAVVTFIEKDQRLNQLDRYELKRTSGENYDNIKETAIEYWKGFEIPVYLFVVLLSSTGHELYYKRFTPISHGTEKMSDEKFYKVSERTNFLAFAKEDNTGGFCRDLFIDYMRCNYKKGSIAYKNPRNMGLSQFPENSKTLFIDMVKKEYKNEIANTFERLNEISLFDEINQSPVASSGAPDDKQNVTPSSENTSTLLIED